MLFDKLTLTKTFDPEISDLYLGMVYDVKYKNKYKREEEIEIDKTKPISYIRLSLEDDNQDKTFKHLKVPENKRIMLFPNLPHESQQERSALYISGSAGSGKSYFINFYVKLYKKFYPKNKVFFFTFNDFKNDRSLDHNLYEFIDFKKFLEEYSDKDKLIEFSLNTE